jgi:hypothetical protein
VTTRRALLSFALLSVLLAFGNFGVAHELIGGDGGYAWALPWQMTRHIAGLFLGGHGLGMNGAPRFCAITLDAMIGLLATLTGSTVYADRIMAAIMFFLSYAGAYLVVKRLLADRTSSVSAEIGAIAAAAIYGANHFTAFAFASGVYDLPLTYILLPWVVLTFFSAAQGRTREAIAVGAATFVLGSAVGAHIAIVLFVALTIILVTLLDSVTRARAVRISIPLFLLCLMLSAWWLLPYTTAVGSGLSSIGDMNIYGWLHWMSERSSLAHAFKLDGYTGGEDLPSAHWYRSFFINALGYWPVFLAIIGLGRRRPLLGSALFGLGLVGLLLSTGVHEPFGVFYAWMIDHVPGFSIFRSPYDKWIVLPGLAFAILGGFGASVVAEKIELLHIDRRLATGLLFLPFVLYPLPQYTGKLLHPTGVAGYLSTIPADYNIAARIVGEGGGGAVSFNSGSTPYPVYTWHYFGEDPLEALTTGRFSAVGDLVADPSIMPAALLAAYLRNFGISWIIVHRDVVNPVPSPDADALVRAGEAEAVVALRNVSVYRLNGTPASLVRIVRTVAVPEPNSVDDFTGRRNLDTASLVLERKNAADLLLKAATPAFGVPRDVVFIPVWSGTGWAWPLLAEKFRCGQGAGVRFAPPIAWSVGAVAISPSPWSFCTGESLTWPARVDDQEINPGMVFFTAGSHRVALQIKQANALSEHPLTQARTRSLLNEGRLSAVAYTAAAATRRLHLVWRTSCPASLTLVASTFTISLSPRAQEVDLPGVLAPGDTVLMYALNGGGCDGWPLERIDMQTVTGESPAMRSVAAQYTTPRTLTLGADVFHFSRMPNMRGIARPRVSYGALLMANMHGFTGAIPFPGNVFPNRGGDISGWSAQDNFVESGKSFSVTPPFEGDSMSIQSTAGFDPSTRYRMTIEYSAMRDVFFSITADRSYASRTYRLRAGLNRREVLLIAPPPNAGTTFALAFDVHEGSLTVERVHIEPISPNGTWASRILMDDRPASLISIERVLPGLIRLRLRDCAPCTLRADVADTPNWGVFGARVLATGIGPGGVPGPMEAFSSGSSVLRIDAGTGDHVVELRYRPLGLALLGLAVTLIAIIIGLLWRHLTNCVGETTGDQQDEQAPFICKVRNLSLILVVCGALVSGVYSESIMESIVFDGLTLVVVVLAIVVFVRAVRHEARTFIEMR